MSNTYCVQCGAVNQISVNDCVGCGSYLAAQPTYAIEPSHWIAGQPREWEPLRNPLAPLTGVSSFSVIHVLALTLRLFATRIWLITKLVFLIATPFEIFKVMSLVGVPPDWQTWISLLLSATCNVLIAPALFYAILKVLETGVAPGVNESFRWGLTKIGRLAVCAAISWTAQLAGYALCVIPGIIVSLVLALVYPVAVLEKGSIGEVFSRSSELTREYRWEIFAARLVMWLLILMVIIWTSLLANSMNSMPLSIGAAVVADIAEQASTILSLMMYLTLKGTPRQGNSILSLTN